ncbi:MAG: L-threonylcarbamoyladenylate synthase [Hyphomicrobiales bacterium]
MDRRVTEEDIAHAAEAIRRGELVAFPTETVYGLGADATNDLAVARIYEAKGRPSFNPLIVHVASLGDALDLAQFTDTARALAEAFWPGPLTLVLSRGLSAPVSELACAGLPTVALRMPRHAVARDLIHAVGRPIVAPSANPSGRISPTSAEHVRAGLGDKVAYVLDAGPTPVGLESTILDCRGKPVLLRPGGLSREEIEHSIGKTLAAASDEEVLAPGQLASHYAPHARLRLNADRARNGEAYLGFGPSPERPRMRNLSAAGNLTEAASNLFRMLHELDAMQPETIAVAPIPHEGLGEAINDRLKRAAAPRR